MCPLSARWHDNGGLPVTDARGFPPWKQAAYKLLKKPFFGAFEKPWRWPSNAKPGLYERFEIAGRHGGSLVGLVRHTSEVARGVILFAHPMGVAAKGFFIKHGHVDLLANAGFHCVTFDFNGFGESTSRSFAYPDDIARVAAWARARFDSLPMAAFGASFGAIQAVSAGAERDCEFRVIVAESVPCSLAAFWKSYNQLGFATLQVLSRLSPERERRLRPEARIVDYQRESRLLLIHSFADPYTPPWHGDAIAKAAPAHVRVERLVLKQGGHALGLRDARETYQTTVLDFLRRELHDHHGC